MRLAQSIFAMLSTVTMPPACLDEIWLSLRDGGTWHIELGKPTSCYPQNQGIDATVSPAMCPAGYTSACDIAAISRQDPSETLWACCPSGYTCDGGSFGCIGTWTSSPSNSQSLIVQVDPGNTMTSAVPTSFKVNVHSIRVAFHASDTADLNVPGATPAPTSTPTLPTSTPTNSPDTNHRAQQLSTGAWVGVGIGSAVGAIAIFSSIVWLIRRRDKKRRLEKQAPVAEQASVDSSWSWTPKLILPSTPVELNAVPGTYELDTSRTTRR